MVTELGESIPDDELREMIEEADRDADGFVVFDDFYRVRAPGSPRTAHRPALPPLNHLPPAPADYEKGGCRLG